MFKIILFLCFLSVVISQDDIPGGVVDASEAEVVELTTKLRNNLDLLEGDRLT